MRDSITRSGTPMPLFASRPTPYRPASELKASRNPYIHGLRGLLALALFLFHVDHSGLNRFGGSLAEGVHILLASMEYGVEIFFGISGIVIVLAFRRVASPAAFIAGRALRIFPVLWVTVLLIAALSVFDTRHVIPLSPAILAVNLVAMAPFSSIFEIHPAAWSISYELVFYFMFVLFAWLARALPRRVALGITLTIGVALVATHIRSACFLSGMVIAAWCAPAGAVRRGMWFPLGGSLLIVAVLSWRECYSLFPYRVVDGRVLLTRPDALFWFLIAFSCASIGLAQIYAGRGLLARLLCQPLLQWLGTISYSLYLWQTLVMGVVKGLMFRVGLPDTLGPWAQLAFLSLSLPLTLLAAALSQRLLEDRFARWVRRVIASRLPRSPGAESA